MYRIKQKGGVFGIYVVTENFPIIKDLDPSEIVNHEKIAKLSKKGIDINIRSKAHNNLIGRNIGGVESNDMHIHSFSKKKSYPISLDEHWIVTLEQNINLVSATLGDIDVRPHLEYKESYLPTSNKCQISYQYWLGPVKNGKPSPFFKNRKNHKISCNFTVNKNIPEGGILIETGSHVTFRKIVSSINLQNNKKGQTYIENVVNYNKLRKDFNDNAATIFDCYINLTNLINQFMNERLRNQTLFSVDTNTEKSVSASLTASLYSDSLYKLDIHKIKSKNKNGGASFSTFSKSSSSSNSGDVTIKSLCIPKNITLYDYFNPIPKIKATISVSEQVSVPPNKMEKYLSILEIFNEPGLISFLKKQKKKTEEIESILMLVKKESESKSISLKPSASVRPSDKKETVIEVNKPITSKPVAEIKTAIKQKNNNARESKNSSKMKTAKREKNNTEKSKKSGKTKNTEKSKKSGKTKKNKKKKKGK